MTFIDARQLPEGAALNADICIVGAGAAGITLAVELIDSGRDVILVESGGFGPDEETQALYDLECVGYPIRENFMNRARYYGGSCNLWAGRSMRLEPFDVEPRPWVPESGWPIGHEEIARHYPRAAEILGLPSMTRFESSTYREEMTEAERALFDAEALQPTVSLWAPKPKRFGRAYRSRLRRARGVRCVLHCNVTAIRLNSAGNAVERLEAATLADRRLSLRARVFVLACGGLENARLLLVSRDRHSEGVGNAHDQVGRCFMDHPRGVFGRVRIEPGRRLRTLRGRPLRDGRVQLGMKLSEEVQRREGLLNHYATLEAEVSQYTEARYQTFVQTAKILLRRGYAGRRRDIGSARFGDIPGMIYLLTPKELIPHVLYRAYSAIKERLRPDRGGGTRVVVYFCEQPPDPASRVTLSRDFDRLGVPRLLLHWRIAPEVTRSLYRLQESIGQALHRSGIGELEAPAGEPRFTDASHHLGTTRMSSGPTRGVVDTECRVHGVANLFIAGSSVFPCAGHANPTLTIVALALRMAERLRGCAA